MTKPYDVLKSELQGGTVGPPCLFVFVRPGWRFVITGDKTNKPEASGAVYVIAAVAAAAAVS